MQETTSWKWKKESKGQEGDQEITFQRKEESLIQAKAAYEACMNVSPDDEEGTSNSDNDEDSNKSVSTYSSEDCNISLFEGCEEWRPIPPHATQLYILIYWKQIGIWIRN
jgi:hypothetical protein